MRVVAWIAMFTALGCSDDRVLGWSSDAGPSGSAGDDGAGGAPDDDPVELRACNLEPRVLASGDDVVLNALAWSDRGLGVAFEENGLRSVAELDAALGFVGAPLLTDSAVSISDPSLAPSAEGFVVAFTNHDCRGEHQVLAAPLPNDGSELDCATVWRLSPDGNEHLRPRIIPFGDGYFAAWRHWESLMAVRVGASGDLLGEPVLLEPQNALPTPRSLAVGSDGPVVLSVIQGTVRHELRLFDSEGAYLTDGSWFDAADAELVQGAHGLALAAQAEGGVTFAFVDEEGELSEPRMVLPDVDAARVAMGAWEEGYLVAVVTESAELILAWLDLEGGVLDHCRVADERANQVALTRTSSGFVLGYRHTGPPLALVLAFVDAEP
jgi:hypothetical protein